jgi:hypothetical protein
MTQLPLTNRATLKTELLLFHVAMALPEPSTYSEGADPLVVVERLSVVADHAPFT